MIFDELTNQFIEELGSMAINEADLQRYRLAYKFGMGAAFVAIADQMEDLPAMYFFLGMGTTEALQLDNSEFFALEDCPAHLINKKSVAHSLTNEFYYGVPGGFERLSLLIGKDSHLIGQKAIAKMPLVTDEELGSIDVVDIVVGTYRGGGILATRSGDEVHPEFILFI